MIVPIDKVKNIINKYDALEKELSSVNIDPKLFAKKSKEYSSLGEIIEIARAYLNFESEKKDLVNMVQDKSNDKDIIELAEKDLNQLLLLQVRQRQLLPKYGPFLAFLYQELFVLYELHSHI